ncbi:hypothetical protein AHAS_Ahas09G0133400 [Arachis hypogaea]
MLVGFIMNIGTCTITMIELWGIYIGIKMVVNKLNVESDSRVALSLFQKNSIELHANILSELSTRFLSISQNNNVTPHNKNDPLWPLSSTSVTQRGPCGCFSVNSKWKTLMCQVQK